MTSTLAITSRGGPLAIDVAMIEHDKAINHLYHRLHGVLDDHNRQSLGTKRTNNIHEG